MTDLGRATLLVATALALTGCLESPLGSKAYQQATATNNKTYDGTGPHNVDFSDAVQASGAHDIPCPITQVTAHWVKEHDWVAEGCGVHVDYTARHKFAVPWQITLVSRAKMAQPVVPLASAAPAAPVAPVASAGSSVAPGTLAPAAVPATVGCSKDTDCKGDRICVSAQCVDPPPKPAY